MLPASHFFLLADTRRFNVRSIPVPASARLNSLDTLAGGHALYPAPWAQAAISLAWEADLLGIMGPALPVAVPQLAG